MTIDRLEQRVRRLELLLLVALLIASGSIAFAMRTKYSQVNERVDVRLLRIVDAQGRPRFQLGAPLPDPQVQGRVYSRSRPVPGLMFLDTLGNETGGLGLFDDLQGGALCFDYATAEAVCLTKATTLGFVGLSMLDTPPTDAAVGRPGSERVQFGVSQRNAQLTLSDIAGQPRIRLSVDSTSMARLEILDEAGQPLLVLPERR